MSYSVSTSRPGWAPFLMTTFAFCSVFVQSGFRRHTRNCSRKFSKVIHSTPGRAPSYTHAAMFEVRVQTATPPRAHVKFPHPFLETLISGEPGVMTLLNVV
jgi:hypothetical protein